MDRGIDIRLTLPLLAIATLSCSAGPKPQQFADPAELLQTSEESYRHGDCNDAAPGLERLTFQLPSRDSMATRARFLLAECQFEQNELLEAARQFRRVMEESPQSTLAPYALLRSGDAQAELWKRPELDPTYGEAAVNTYRELITRFPDSPAAQRAMLKLKELSEQFAEKDYKVGVFYQRLGAFDSAILYFKNLVAQYPQTKHASLALVKLVEIYDKLKYREEMQEICTHLGQFYPNERGADDRCSEVAATASSSPNPS
jgi:outer membrane protein assembly factor BamD